MKIAAGWTKLPSLICFIVLLVAACAPSSQPASPQVPAASKATSAVAPTPTKVPEPKTSAQTPRRGGTWRVGGEQLGSPPALDPSRRQTTTNQILVNAVSCKPVMWDERPDRTPGAHEQVVPDLAERWESSSDGKVWTFHLRKGVLLPPPSNREITAEDVVNGLIRAHAILPKQALNIGSPAMFTDPKTGKFDPHKPNVEAVDRYTVRITLSEVEADFMSQIGGHFWAIHFYKDFYEPTDDGWGELKKAENFKGCGAWMMSEYIPGSHVTFVRNPNYYNKDLPYVDSMEMRFIFEPSVGVAALRGGQLESWGLLVTMPLSLSKELESVASLDLKYLPGAWFWPWKFDVNNPPFNDIRVRRAVSLALDRKGWIKDLYFGHGQNTVMIMPYVEFWNLPPEKMGEDGKYYTTYDPAEAKRLLAEAGYSKGLTFELLTNNSGGHVVSHPMLELAAGYLDAIGIKMKINVMDYGAYQKEPVHVGGVYQSGLSSGNLAFFVHQTVHPDMEATGGVPTYKGLVDKDREFKRAADLMDQQRKTLDTKKRLDLVHELQRIWARNLWMMFYPVPDSSLINNKKVHGYNPAAGWNAGSYKYVWIEP